MRWIEVIKLQAPAQYRESLVELIQGELRSIPRVEGLVAARLVTDRAVGTELALLLDWDRGASGSAGSDLGNRFVRLFEELGLAHRATWLDVTDQAAAGCGRPVSNRPQSRQGESS